MMNIFNLLGRRWTMRGYMGGNTPKKAPKAGKAKTVSMKKTGTGGQKAKAKAVGAIRKGTRRII